jgi:Fur family zinc uptake transcriptional regulator
MIGAEANPQRPKRRPRRGLARRAATEGSASLTPLRHAVLSAIRAAGHPLGAYELIARLEGKLGRRVRPPTVYRSLDHLCRAGLVVRLESLNAFMARNDPAAPRGNAIFICGDCRSAQEVVNPQLSGLLDHNAMGLRFRIARRIVEIEGTCARCIADANAKATPICEKVLP